MYNCVSVATNTFTIFGGLFVCFQVYNTEKPQRLIISIL